MTEVSDAQTNSCNSDSVDQLVLTKTRSGSYKKCSDHAVQEVIVQMHIEPFVTVRAIR